MAADSRDYYQQRAETELELAQTAGHANAVRAHYLLAGFYLDRVHGDGAGTDVDEDPAGPENSLLVRTAGKAIEEHGDLALHYAATRIEACGLAGDAVGLRTWQRVRAMIELAQQGERQRASACPTAG